MFKKFLNKYLPIVLTFIFIMTSGFFWYTQKAQATFNITFMEPGGDATFNVATTANGGFWGSTGGAGLVTDFVHGSHIKSIKYGAGGVQSVTTPNGVVSDSGKGGYWTFKRYF